MDDLKIYCQNEEDQLNVVSFLEENFSDVKISTWDPDPVDTGSWGMFVDDFPIEVWEMLCRFLDNEDAFVLDEEVEMALECDEPRMYCTRFCARFCTR